MNPDLKIENITLTPAVIQQIEQAILKTQRGRKIDAIKILRTALNLGLKEAKEFQEAFASRPDPDLTPQPCSDCEYNRSARYEAQRAHEKTASDVHKLIDQKEAIRRELLQRIAAGRSLKQALLLQSEALRLTIDLTNDHSALANGSEYNDDPAY